MKETSIKLKEFYATVGTQLNLYYVSEWNVIRAFSETIANDGQTTKTPVKISEYQNRVMIGDEEFKLTWKANY